MKTFFSYQKLQLKRIFKSFPYIAVLSLVFFTASLFIIGLFLQNINLTNKAALTAKTSRNENGSKKYSIGIIGDMNEPYMDFAISSLEALDTSKFSIDIKLMDLQEAKKELSKGKISAYVIIPQGFIESIENGQNDKQIIYVTSDSQSGFGEIIKNEIAEIVTTLITHSQSGIFAMQRELYRQNNLKNFDSLTYDLNIKYAHWALSRSKFSNIEETGLTQGLSIQVYYTASILLLFLMLTSLSTNFFFTNRSRALNKLLLAKKLGSSLQVFAELFAYFIFLEAIFFILTIILSFAVKNNIISFTSWKFNNSAKEFFFIFLKSIPSVIMISSITFLLYEFLSDVVGSLILQFIFTFIFCYLAGYFYPLNFFPETFQKIAEKLPQGLLLKYTLNLFSLKENFVSNISYSLYILLYSSIFIALSIFKRCLCNRSF